MMLRVEGYLRRMEQLKTAGYSRRPSRASSGASADRGPGGMIAGAGTLNASGASDRPEPQEVDPGVKALSESVFRSANAYVLQAVRDEGAGDLRRAFNSYSRAIAAFIKGLEKIPDSPQYKAHKDDVRERCEEYLVHAGELKKILEDQQKRVSVPPRAASCKRSADRPGVIKRRTHAIAKAALCGG